MKTKSFLNCVVTASCLAWPVVADTQTKVRDEYNNTARNGVGQVHPSDRVGRSEKASDLIGTEVRNYQNEKLGKVDELAVDLESGRVVGVIVSTGGVLGVGDTRVGVVPEALHYDQAAKVVHLAADQAKLKDAPKADTTNWEFSDPQRVGEIYKYYGKQPYWQQATADAARMGHVEKASKIMGMTVQNLQNEKLGKVENLMVDLAAGRVVAVVLSSGGFLGLGDELSAVPPGALKYGDERKTIVLDATRDSLSAAPHFKGDQWPDLGQSSYTEGVYRAYRVDPYFSPSKAQVDADNTARNARDRNNRSITPIDQGNNQTDINLTSRIRKDVLAEKDLSLNARNVKIITSNGRVTLRGAVNNEAEKRRIAEIARSVATGENVDDQLEVKSPAK